MECMEMTNSLFFYRKINDGGKGSGNFGHAGQGNGKVGGSAPSNDKSKSASHVKNQCNQITSENRFDFYLRDAINFLYKDEDLSANEDAKRTLEKIKQVGLENSTIGKLLTKKMEGQEVTSDFGTFYLNIHFVEPCIDKGAQKRALKGLSKVEAGAMKQLFNTNESIYVNWEDTHTGDYDDIDLPKRFLDDLNNSVLAGMFGFSSISDLICISEDTIDSIKKLCKNSPFQADCYRGDVFHKDDIKKIKVGMTMCEVLQQNSTRKNTKNQNYSISNTSYNPITAKQFSNVSAGDYKEKHARFGKENLISISHVIPQAQSIPNYTLSMYPNEFENFIATEDYIVDTINVDENGMYEIIYQKRGS